MIELLESLNPAERAALEKQCRWKTYSPNEVIIEKGDESTDVFFILDGDVRIANYSTTGREITYANLGVGAFFGEIAALDQRPRSASVAALSGCVVAAVSSKAFAELVENTPSIATKLIKRFCHIIRVSDDRIMDVSTMRSVQRVCQELMRLSGGTVIHPLPNQGEIAGLASTTRETVGRGFHELTAAGIIERKQRALYYPRSRSPRTPYRQSRSRGHVRHRLSSQTAVSHRVTVGIRRFSHREQDAHLEPA